MWVTLSFSCHLLEPCRAQRVYFIYTYKIPSTGIGRAYVCRKIYKRVYYTRKKGIFIYTVKPRRVVDELNVKRI